MKTLDKFKYKNKNNPVMKKNKSFKLIMLSSNSRERDECAEIQK
jgi:hypothetical protein